MIIVIIIIIVYVFSVKNLPRGIRNNNPFNIRGNYVYRKDYVCFKVKDSFVYFLTIDKGLEAGYRLLFYYFKNGQRKTYPVDEYIKRYAESSGPYTEFLRKKFGENIKFSSIYELGKAQVKFENGTTSFLTEEMFKKAFNDAEKRQFKAT